MQVLTLTTNKRLLKKELSMHAKILYRNYLVTIHTSLLAHGSQKPSFGFNYP